MTRNSRIARPVQTDTLTEAMMRRGTMDQRRILAVAGAGLFFFLLLALATSMVFVIAHFVAKFW